MESKYEANKFEREIYKKWEESGAFAPDRGDKGCEGNRGSGSQQPYTIIMPPPNANDPLHIGHAMFVTVEDILIRYRRMLGKKVLWLPGTDHAGIETQYVFEKKLAKEGKSRFDFDRETLYKMIWDYVQKNSEVAIDQIKRLGASADWSRKKFTLDEDIVDFVLNTFIQLHKDGLVYRDLKLVNYCTKCGTAFSNLEINHEERKTPLYYLKYGPFTLATVRPETKFGDTAIAVHPNDKRYQKYVGQEIEVGGLLGKFKIKVIADEYVDPKFGTGAVKITPYHDLNDFAVWKRHLELPKPIQVIDFSGKLNENTGKYAGLKVARAREIIIEDLKKLGLLEKADENYHNTVGVCYRCRTVIEPLPLLQFFIKVKTLAELVLKALQSNKVKIYGAGHDKILKHWLTNLEDWNVSRQIVWGIRIPAWYKKDSEEYVVAKESPGKDFVQETDTFDTWFGSAQWPVATLKTGKAGDFETFYPTDVMETGYDILPFWVMRMLMMGIYLTGEAPFKNVYLHGLIRDEKGQKMSKSKGNVINPLVMVNRYGADALRMALVIRSTPGLDKGVGENDIRAMRNFTNKIWNACRFVTTKRQVTSQADTKFLEHLDKVIKNVTKQLTEYRIGLAAETVYTQFWHWFCDEAIESNKRQETSDKTIFHGLVTFLKLLHPFVPFVTEKCWEEIKDLRKYPEMMLINAPWPESTKARKGH